MIANINLDQDGRLGQADFRHFERAATDAGHTIVAGIDEVGRGALAGPVVAACVVLPETFDASGINDSKKLTPRQRQQTFVRISAEAISVGIGIIDSNTIDRINILQATYKAMQIALETLNPFLAPSLILIDGLPVPFLARSLQQAIVGGDGRSITIAAASIVAKVTRDQMMIDYHSEYPEYGFHGHKGYGALSHIAALDLHGPCPIHRRSFAPVTARCGGLFSTLP